MFIKVLTNTLKLNDKFCVTEQSEPTYQLVNRGTHYVKIKRLKTGVIDTLPINIFNNDWVWLYKFTYPII